MSEGKKEILLGDCIDLMRSFETESIDLCVTDPPYKLTSGGKVNKIWGGVFKKETYNNSGLLFEVPLPIDWMKEVYRVLKNGTHFYCFINDKNLGDFLNAGIKSGFDLHNILVMKKDTHTPNRWYLKNCEYILFFKKGKAKNINNMGTTTVIDVKMPKNKIHPSEKPVYIYDVLIKNSSNENELCLDPFGGSGTIIESCLKNNRQFIAIEKDPNHFEKMKRRGDFNKNFEQKTLFGNEM